MDFNQSRVEKFMDQNFSDIRKQCLSTGEIFEDPEFLPDNAALFLKDKTVQGLKWCRPNMLCNEPHLVVGGTSSMDLTTGEFGSPAFVAACSVLANHEDFWKRVVPDPMLQEWNAMKPQTYTGVFKFRFWRFGTWTEVVVDDRLPVLDNQLFGIRSTEKNEFWSAILEKAYAKVVGCYEALQSMDAGEILQDLTGGIIEPVDLRETISDAQSKTDLFNDICDSRMSGRALLTCWIDKDTPIKDEFGLINGTVYAVNAVREIKLGTGLLNFFKTDTIRLVRLRNPTGDTEWTGAWSDNSAEWKKISDSEKKKMGLVFDGDGEFWMSFDDFCNYFTNLSVCRVLHSLSFFIADTWKETSYRGSWTYNVDKESNTAGGCLDKNPDTFMQNPQFRFNVTDTKEGAAPTIMIQLQQSETRANQAVKQIPKNSIGFQIARVEINRQYKMHQPIFKWSAYPFSKERSAFSKLNLPEGRYVIIPCMEDQGINGEFLLRVFCETNLTFCELNAEYPPKTFFSGLRGYPTSAISVNVVNGVKLFNAEKELGNVYVSMTCEGVTVRSKTFRENSDPYFDAGAIFYRKETRMPVVFKAYHEGLACDTFIGQGTISGNVEMQVQPVPVPLFGKNNWKRPTRFPGTLYVNVQTADSLTGL